MPYTYNIVKKLCPECKQSFNAKGRSTYCSIKCRTESQKNRLGVNRDKTLCKWCRECRTYTYLRRILRRDRSKSNYLFKFVYCDGNKNIVSFGNWGPSSPKNKNGRTYVISTKRPSKEFQLFLKDDPSNVISYINKNPLDNRLKNMREITKVCSSQTLQGEDSIFPGVYVNSFYKHHIKGRYHGKKPKKWNTRIKIYGETVYLGSSETELKAAHKYYKKMRALGRDINKETPAYKKYKCWLESKLQFYGLN
jgi:hypothetical protein